MPAISVVIPVCNVEKYLPQCLDSVMKQTFTDLEIICVDDGSKDSSGLILDEYAKKDCRIRVFHKENTGYGNSMNIGVRNADGDYISVIESDDFAEADMLEKLYLAAIKSGAEITKANHYNYKDGKDYFCDWLKDFPKGEVISSREYPLLLYKANTIWTCLFKRSFLLQHDIRFHETPGASFQDISFALQGWLWAERIYFIEDAVLHYRNDNPGSSMHNPSKVFCVFDEYEWLEKKFEKFWTTSSEIESYFVAAKYADYLSHYNRVAMQYQYALLIRMKESLEMDLQKGRMQKHAFQERVWKAVCEINDDINTFYQRTAKGVQDTRLEVCKFKNEETYIRAFLEEIENYPQVIIYGAGKVGQQLADCLLKKGLSFDCFVVSKATEEKIDCMGIPVKSLDEVRDQAQSCAIIIAVTEKSQYELYQNLLKYNFRNIFRMDSVMRLFLQRESKVKMP